MRYDFTSVQTEATRACRDMAQARGGRFRVELRTGVGDVAPLRALVGERKRHAQGCEQSGGS